MKRFLALLLVAGCSSGEPEQENARGDETGPVAESGGVVESPTALPFGQRVMDARYSGSIENARVVDTLTTANGDAWLLVAGVECDNCDAPESLFLIDTKTGTLGPFWSPGEYFEMGVEEGEPHALASVYAGECHAGPGEDLVIIVEERARAGGGASRYGMRATPGAADPVIRYDSTDALQAEVDAAVAAGSCRELDGRRQYS